MESARRWVPWSAVAVVWLSAVGCSQEPPAIELHEVAHTTTLGGDAERIVLAADDKRFLTVGQLGDILWWDLDQQALLRRFESVGRYVGAVAIHPSSAWAVVAVSPEGDGPHAVFALDLANGGVRQILVGEVRDLAFSASGESLGVLEIKLLGERRFGMYEQCAVTYSSEDLRSAAGAQPRSRTEWEPWSPKQVHFPSPAGNALAVSHGPTNSEGRAACVSHRGIARGEGKGSRLRRSAPEPATHSLASHLDTWIETTAITDTGIMVAADLQGQLFVQGLAGNDLCVRSGHLGETHALQFSPDGKFVAVQGLGAVRFVDLDGAEVAVLHGTYLVEPGPDGADFWLLGRHELRLWNAASCRERGERLRWESPVLPLLRTNEGSLGNRLSRAAALAATRSGQVHGPQALWTLAAFAVVDGQPWVATETPLSMSPGPMRRRPSGAFAALPDHGAHGDAISFLAMPDDRVLFVAGMGWTEYGPRPGCTVRSYDRDGGLVALQGFAWVPLWVTRVGDEVLLGATDGTVHRRRSSDLGEIGSEAFNPLLLQLAAFDRDRLLATNGPSLQLLDTQSLAVVQTLPLPTGIDAVDVFAVAPDRRHVAIARGSEVRILAIR